MVDTLPDIQIPPATIVDLYAASGIDPGIRIKVQNTGCYDCNLYTKFDEPDIDIDGSQVIARGESTPNDIGDLGAWAYSVGGTRLNVRVY